LVSAISWGGSEKLSHLVLGDGRVQSSLASSEFESEDSEPLTEAPSKLETGERLQIIDKLRGLVIVIMVLDHVRDFFHEDAFRFSATNLDKTTAILFATRWVTHVCAPTFVFLAGVSIFLQWSGGRRGWRLTAFLTTRGLWLITLEVTLVTIAFTFAWDGAFLQVIWAIGFSMILLGALCWLPPMALLAIGIAIVCGHDLVDSVDAKALGGWAPLWTLMFEPGSIHLPFHDFKSAYVSYPAIPWFGIMAVGFGVGGVFLLPPSQRDRALVATGVALLLAFALLRGLDHYGDPSPWSWRPDSLRSALSFLKVTKYPPSLDYTLATLGIALSIAPSVARIGGPFGRALRTFGRTPLFTYLLHLYVARGLAILLALHEGLSPWIFHDTFSSGGRLASSGWGVNLFYVYALWVTVLLILWPASTWYAGVKARRRDWWLSYL
jgi:uncharacterized membrane protein